MYKHLSDAYFAAVWKKNVSIMAKKPIKFTAGAKKTEQRIKGKKHIVARDGKFYVGVFI